MFTYRLYDLELNKLFYTDTYQTNAGNTVGDPTMFEYLREISFSYSSQSDYPEIKVTTTGTSLNQELEKINYNSDKHYNF